MARLRAEFGKGNKDVACELTVLDPSSTVTYSRACKSNIEAKKGNSKKWHEFSFFMKGHEFAAWYNNEIDDSGKERDWTKEKLSVPADQQLWFLKNFFETWMKNENTELITSLPEVRAGLEEMVRIQKWTPESYDYIFEKLPAKIETRLARVEAKEQSENLKSDIH